MTSKPYGTVSAPRLTTSQSLHHPAFNGLHGWKIFDSYIHKKNFFQRISTFEIVFKDTLIICTEKYILIEIKTSIFVL